MRKLLIAFTALSLLMVSCVDPEDAIEESVDSTTTQDNARLEQEWNSLDATVQEILAAETSAQPRGTTSKATSCYSVMKLDLLSDPMELIVKFNSQQCTSDNRTRSGALTMTFTGRYVDAGTKITTNTADYEVDGYKLTGKKVVTNMGAQPDNSIKYKVEVTNGTVTDKNGLNLSKWITSTRYRVWTAGYSTPSDITDDFYEIFGVANGVNRNNESFSWDVLESDPLKLNYACWKLTHFPNSGTLTLKPQGKQDRVIDYGDGTCDRQVRVTVGSATLDITF